jgi:hypothetical protein
LGYNKNLLAEKISENNYTQLDQDLFLIPNIIEKTVLPKLISIAESFYDPMSSTQTELFSQLILDLVQKFPSLTNASFNTKVSFKTLNHVL